jgi:hypothetical protein
VSTPRSVAACNTTTDRHTRAQILLRIGWPGLGEESCPEAVYGSSAHRRDRVRAAYDPDALVAAAAARV